MHKKKWLSIATLVFVIFLVRTVFALDINIRRGSDQIIQFFVDWAEPFLQYLLGGGDYGIGGLVAGNLLFEKLLFFLLLLGIVYIALKRIRLFRDNKAVLWTVSIILPLIAIRFIDFEWLNTIILSYVVLGVALAGILPFVIYFFFLTGVFPESSGARKIGWIFFIVVYYGLWSTSKDPNYGWIYFITMIAAAIFLLLDGTIHRIMRRQRWNEADRSSLRKAITEIDRQLSDMRHYSVLPDDEKNREINDLIERRRNLRRQMY
jgi:hypothetical protein